VIGVLLLSGQVAVAPRLLELRSERFEGRSTVVVVAAGPLADVPVRRDGAEVLVSLPVSAPVLPYPPTVALPLRSLRVERAGGGVRLRIGVAAEVPYEVRREADRVVLLFGVAPAAAAPAPGAGAPASAGAAAAPAPIPPSTLELYRGLFPPSSGPPTDAGDQAGEAPAAPASSGSPADRPDGLSVGSMVLRPSLLVSYVDADVSLESPEPTRDRYVEARPGIAAELPLRDGNLHLDYQARVRRGATLDGVNGVSHEANAGLEAPAGPSITLRGQGHFAHGLLETREVDPGGEYFFQLSPFTRWEFGGGARVRPGGRFDVDLSGSLDHVNVEEGGGFFDYERRFAGAGVGMEIGPNRRASLSYAFEQVPASADRPEAESRVHAVSLGIEGEVLALTTGRASLGYTRRESPQAGPGGQVFEGLAFGAQLKREFGRSAYMTLSADRATELSNFEQNAFYVMTSVQATLTAPLPFSISATAGGGYHVNRYLTVAPEIGEPRRDEIVDWLVGVGRTITRWAYVRVDYRQDHRNSNLDIYDQSPHAFYVQIGLGYGQSGLR